MLMQTLTNLIGEVPEGYEVVAYIVLAAFVLVSIIQVFKCFALIIQRIGQK